MYGVSRVVRGDDLRDDPMAHHVLRRQAHPSEPADPRQELLLEAVEPAARPPGTSTWVVSPVTTTFDPNPIRSQEHLHLLGGGVLRLVEDDEAAIQRVVRHEEIIREIQRIGGRELGCIRCPPLPRARCARRSASAAPRRELAVLRRLSCSRRKGLACPPADGCRGRRSHGGGAPSALGPGPGERPAAGRTRLYATPPRDRTRNTTSSCSLGRTRRVLDATSLRPACVTGPPSPVEQVPDHCDPNLRRVPSRYSSGTNFVAEVVPASWSLSQQRGHRVGGSAPSWADPPEHVVDLVLRTSSTPSSAAPSACNELRIAVRELGVVAPRQTAVAEEQARARTDPGRGWGSNSTGSHTSGSSNRCW